MSAPAPAPAGNQPPNGSNPALHTVLPPLILGTATFNHQYVTDPQRMPYHDIVSRAVSLGVTAFDTSPYYGPSELLLGAALDSLMHPSSPSTATPVPRSQLTLITKCGRIAGDAFDYSPAWIRYSILRSLKRLHTPYLDLVYTHDAEFVSPAEVLAAVRELRRLRDDEGLLRYVGVSGFPVDVLADLAEMVLAETGEPLDAVLSYGHFTVQNRGLARPLVDGTEGAETCPLQRLKDAGVDVVLNASILGMGLLTSRGIPTDPEELVSGGETSPLSKWHPSPPGLRAACKKLAAVAEAAGERLESLAIRWSLEEWARIGAKAGVDAFVPGAKTNEPQRVGATVCGVSSVAELEETVKEWEDVMAGLGPSPPNGTLDRRDKVGKLVRDGFWTSLGEWKDYVWPSPGEGFVNQRKPEERGTFPDDGIVSAHELRIQLNG